MNNFNIRNFFIIRNKKKLFIVEQTVYYFIKLNLTLFQQLFHFANDFSKLFFSKTD